MLVKFLLRPSIRFDSDDHLKVSHYRSNAVTVVLFSADWAEQCKQILDVMAELSKMPDMNEISFLNVPAEEFSEISLKHQVCTQICKILLPN